MSDDAILAILGRPDASRCPYQSIDEAIEDILLYLEEARFSIQRTRSEHTDPELTPALPLTYWSPVLPILPATLSQTFQDDRSEQPLINPDALTPADLAHHWDVRLLYPEFMEEDADHRFQLFRCRAVPLSTLRGRFRPLSGVNAELAWAMLERDGTYRVHRIYASHLAAGNRWELAPYRDPIQRQKAPWQSAIAAYVGVAMSLGFNAYFDWHVALSLDDGPAVSFATDPVGAREAFRLRDIPPGRSRRVALHHWVREHWRRHRKEDPEAETFVRQHLSGAQVFHWHGLRCAIQVSGADREKNRQLRALRRGRQP